MRATAKARSTAIAASVLLAASLAHSEAKPAAKAGSWLDGGPRNWNRPGAPVPKASPGDAANRERCKDLLRRPSGAPDRAVAGQGWYLYGALQRFGRTVVVTGASDLDGMCRPLGFQVFVFVRQRFAGTLSPGPMNARTDGSQSRFTFSRERSMSCEFARYAAKDALCCPSGASTVDFEIEERSNVPVLVPRKPVPVPKPAAN